ncbi:MAG: hypothetical protein V5B36_11815 [Candidatus Accumulibacter sp. UW25]|jgi:hypothetical protein
MSNKTKDFTSATVWLALQQAGGEGCGYTKRGERIVKAIFEPIIRGPGGKWEDDRQMLERYLILSSELTQQALNIACYASQPQELEIGLHMLEIQFCAMLELAKKLGVKL